MRDGDRWIVPLGAVIAVLFMIAAGAVVAQSPPPGAACTRVTLAVVVDLDDVRHAALILHEREAVRAGFPRVLHVDRAGAAGRRAQDLRGVPTRAGFDRDEYPPAVAAESGLRPDGSRASIAYVESAVNRSGGSVMGRQLLPFCDGQAFVIEP